MVKKIVRDEFFLKQKSEPATKADQQVAIDLLDTLKANEAGCVGLAANMIGVRKCVIAVSMGFMNVAMFNPVIVSKKGEYEERARNRTSLRSSAGANDRWKRAVSP